MGVGVGVLEAVGVGVFVAVGVGVLVAVGVGVFVAVGVGVLVAVGVIVGCCGKLNSKSDPVLQTGAGILTIQSSARAPSLILGALQRRARRLFAGRFCTS